MEETTGSEAVMIYAAIFIPDSAVVGGMRMIVHHLEAIVDE